MYFFTFNFPWLLSSLGPQPFIDTNIVDTFALLETARHFVTELGAEARGSFRFLHVSTDKVYGTLGAIGLFSEETQYAPNSPYAASKASADHLVRAYDALDRLRPPSSNPAMNDRSSYRDLKTFVPDRPGHDRRYAIDATTIRREIGWSPRHSFEDGLEATARWYLEHRDWCDAVQTGRYDRERLGLEG